MQTSIVLWWTLRRLGRRLESSEDQSVQRSSAEALVRIGPAALQLLEAVLNTGKHPGAKYLAAEALGEIGPAAVEPLIAALGTSSGDVRWSVCKALRRIGSHAVKPLAAALTEESEDKSDGSKASQAAYVLGMIGDPLAVEPLVAALGAQSYWVRAHAAQALGVIGDLRAVRPLVATLQHESPPTRRDAAKALGVLASRAQVDDRYQITVGTLEELRRRASPSGALWRTRASLAVEPLVAALQDSDSDLRQAAAIALVKGGWQPSNASERILQAAAVEDWGAVAQEGFAAVAPLIAVAQERDGLENYRLEDRRRFSAAAALCDIADSRALGPIVAAVKDDRIPWPARHGVAALRRILEEQITAVSTQDLGAVASLADSVLGIDLEWHHLDPDYDYSETTDVQVDCSPVKQLAQRELTRREAKG